MLYFLLFVLLSISLMAWAHERRPCIKSQGWQVFSLLRRKDFFKIIFVIYYFKFSRRIKQRIRFFLPIYILKHFFFLRVRLMKRFDRVNPKP